MKSLTVKCTYHSCETPRRNERVKKYSFLVKLAIDEAGHVSSWEVDDLTCCFYTQLVEFSTNKIEFAGSELKGHSGTLQIYRNANKFTQRSVVNGEWLIFRGTCLEEAHFSSY